MGSVSFSIYSYMRGSVYCSIVFSSVTFSPYSLSSAAYAFLSSLSALRISDNTVLYYLFIGCCFITVWGLYSPNNYDNSFISTVLRLLSVSFNKSN